MIEKISPLGYKTAKEFLDELKTKRDNAAWFAEGWIVNEKVEIKASDYSFTNFHLAKIRFTEPVFFEGVDLKEGIKFEGCTFEKNLTFNNCRNSGYNIGFSLEGAAIQVNNCTIDQFTSVQGTVFESGILISNESKIGSIIFRNFKTTAARIGLSIKDSLVQKSVDVISTEIVGSLIIENSTIIGKVRIDQLTTSSLSLSKSTFKDDIFISGGLFKAGISISKSEFEDDLNFDYVKIPSALTIRESNFNQLFTIDMKDDTTVRVGAIKEIYLSQCTVGRSFILNGFNESIPKTQIIYSPEIKGTFRFMSCHFNECLLSGDNHSGNFIFNSCAFIKLEFNNLFNYGNISLASCAAERGLKNSEIVVMNSDLGNAHFYNFSFLSFSRTVIIDSVISSIQGVAVSWFDNDQLQLGAGDRLRKRRREVYRQLKANSEKFGDKIQALDFRAEELKSHQRFVKLILIVQFKKFFKRKRIQRGRMLSKVEESFWSNLGAYVSLLLSATNDYGRNWLKPASIIVVFTFLAYPFYVISTSNRLGYKISLTSDSLELTITEFFMNSRLIPQLFNPTRSLIRMYDQGTVIGTELYWLDGFHKIVLAFFLFQIISAFRKYIGK
jgi:hypothetical protein